MTIDLSPVVPGALAASSAPSEPLLCSDALPCSDELPCADAGLTVVSAAEGSLTLEPAA